jgi:hypothetical protein
MNAIQETGKTFFPALCFDLGYKFAIPVVFSKNMITRLLSLPNLLANKEVYNKARFPGCSLPAELC